MLLDFYNRRPVCLRRLSVYMIYSSSNINATKHGYIPGIDGLRALAVLSVMIFHLDANLLPGGFSGVDVFFVISGYVVSASLAKEQLGSFWRFAIDFYSRRIIRIYPALVLCLLATALLQSLLVPPSWLSTTSSKTGIAAFFGMSNFALIWFNDGYFSPRVEFNTFTHTWSLAVEEQFYLLFPIVFFIWLKNRERNDFFGTISKWMLVFLLVISLLISWYQTDFLPDHAYYLLPSRFWELACGAVLYKLHAKNILFFESKKYIEISVICGLILLSLGFAFADPKAFPFPWAMLPVLGAMILIAGVTSDIQGDSRFGRLMNNAPIVYIGKISYSLYLWHWPIAVVFRWTVGLENPVAIIAAVLCTVMMSVFSYHLIERPIRHGSFVSSKSNWIVVSRGGATIVVSAIVAMGIFVGQPYLSLSVTKDESNWYPYPKEKLVSPNASKMSNHLYQGRSIYVLGDSHAGAYSTMLRMLENEQGVAVKQFSKAGCAVANLLIESSPECAKFIEDSIAKIKANAKPGDVVFLASLRMNRLGDQWRTFDESDVEKKQSGPNSVQNRLAALKEAKHIVDSFESSDLTVVIDAPKPIFKSPPFRCSDWFNSGNPICKGGGQLSREFLLNHRKPIMENLGELARLDPKLIIWDPFPILCPSDICMTTDNNLPLFFDGDHLSGYGNRRLYPSFLSLVQLIWKSNG